MNLTVEDISKTLKENDYTPGEKGQEALDNDFDMRQGKGEAIQDFINREEMMSVSLQN